jgi:murein DD-endopeptidase MepM/ murein hydrolase activator NlpD
LIQYYKRAVPEPVGTLDGLPLYLPLDGAPRKVSSGLGDIRGSGHHAHRGLDFESTSGEPVRAVAAGVVFKAGFDLPRGGSRSFPPDRSRYVSRSSMGRGGLFVMIRHRPRLYSVSMHLQRFVVKDGERVRGGQLIGYVGRSGIKRDNSHLHFEIRRNYKPVDPIPLLGSSVFPPEACYRGHLIKANQPRLWRRARYRRWLRRKRRRARRGPTAKKK